MPTNKSAPKVHTITVITIFVNRFIFIFIFYWKQFNSRKQGNSQLHINGLQGIAPHLYRTKVRIILVTAKYFAKNFQFAIIQKIQCISIKQKQSVKHSLVKLSQYYKPAPCYITVPLLAHKSQQAKINIETSCI